MTDVDKKATLKCVTCIHYLVQLKNDKGNIQALIGSDSKINALSPAYIKKLGLQI